MLKLLRRPCAQPTPARLSEEMELKKQGGWGGGKKKGNLPPDLGSSFFGRWVGGMFLFLSFVDNKLSPGLSCVRVSGLSSKRVFEKIMRFVVSFVCFLFFAGWGVGDSDQPDV